MKKFILMLSVFLATLSVSAQDEILQKYTKHGDVTTTSVSKNMLDRLSEEQRNLPGLDAMLEHIDRMTIYSARQITNIAKQMRTKVPKQLQGDGYEVKVSTKMGDTGVTILRSKKNPQSVVLVIDGKPNTSIISMTGNFPEDL